MIKFSAPLFFSFFILVGCSDPVPEDYEESKVIYAVDFDSYENKSGFVDLGFFSVMVGGGDFCNDAHIVELKWNFPVPKDSMVDIYVRQNKGGDVLWTKSPPLGMGRTGEWIGPNTVMTARDSHGRVLGILDFSQLCK